MSNNSSNRVVRTLGVPAMALVLASSSMVALAGTAAAKPMPDVSIDASCVSETAEQTNDGDPQFDHVLRARVSASYKGKWVAFTVNATLLGAPKAQVTKPRWDSNLLWPEFDPNKWRTGGITNESGPATVDVQILDNKGAPVGPVFHWSGTCELPTR